MRDVKEELREPPTPFPSTDDVSSENSPGKEHVARPAQSIDLKPGK
jgi:hypothetical protein